MSCATSRKRKRSRPRPERNRTVGPGVMTVGGTIMRAMAGRVLGCVLAALAVIAALGTLAESLSDVFGSEQDARKNDHEVGSVEAGMIMARLSERQAPSTDSESQKFAVAKNEEDTLADKSPEKEQSYDGKTALRAKAKQI